MKCNEKSFIKKCCNEPDEAQWKTHLQKFKYSIKIEIKTKDEGVFMSMRSALKPNTE